eukprot:TRINITY_DN56997_c0_g1_i1.p1 TRINITY_DN56997_c0_g1~~TRINITY_DN56997_c0_g1_i1.p1  ORF type:complete len:464 (-),score=31.02 TRINITY_DN56997_c0_g1_i1:78-1469(-)
MMATAAPHSCEPPPGSKHAEGRTLAPTEASFFQLPGEMCYAHTVAKKGLCVFSKKKIPKGSLLWEEPSFFSLPCSNAQTMTPQECTKARDWEQKEAERLAHLLPSHQLGAIAGYDISDGASTDKIKTGKELLLGALNSSGIAHKNERCLFCLTSILNHSCDPTCTLYYKEKPEKGASGAIVGVQAVKDILPDTELTFSYLGQNMDSFMDTTRRRKALATQWYFHCVCNLCTSEKEYDERCSVACPKCDANKSFCYMLKEKPDGKEWNNFKCLSCSHILGNSRETWEIQERLASNLVNSLERSEPPFALVHDSIKQLGGSHWVTALSVLAVFRFFLRSPTALTLSANSVYIAYLVFWARQFTAPQLPILRFFTVAHIVQCVVNQMNNIGSKCQPLADFVLEDAPKDLPKDKLEVVTQIAKMGKRTNKPIFSFERMSEVVECTPPDRATFEQINPPANPSPQQKD